MKKTWKKLMALLCVSAMVLTGFSALAADDDMDISGSKIADPTELECPDRETTVTLSLPSGEYQNKVDIVFVMDNSTSTKNSGIDFSENVEELLNSIVANNTGVDLKIGIVKFRGYATDMLGTGLTKYDDSSSATILAAVANNTVPGSGSNGHSGLVMAEKLLSADTEVADDHKYVVFLTDGKNYIWNNASDEPVTIYQQWLKSATVQASGKPNLNQYAGITQKENGAYPSIYNSVPQITDHTPLIFSEGLDINLYDSTYYTNLYNSTHDDLKGETKYDEPAYYTKYYPESSYSGNTGTGDGTVTTRAIANTGTDVIPNMNGYKTYYEYVPQEGTFWADVDYLQINPYKVVLNEEDGKYYYDTDQVNEDFFLWHATPLEKGPYVLGHYWKETIAAKYNTGAIVFYDTGSGTGSHITQSFDQWLVENSDFGAWINESDQVLALFDGIDNSIRYMVSEGVVTDIIEDPFTLKNADALEGFTMTLGGEAVTGTFESGKWTFAGGDYEVEYDDSTKTITWKINVPIENLKPVTLSYVLELPEDAEGGEYATNKSAILEYTSSDGTKDGTYTFDVPKVTYTPCVEISVEKVWDDDDDAAGFRPEKVTVILTDGTNEWTLELSESNDWKGTFTHDMENNKHIQASKLDKFTVDEEDIDNYTKAITGNATDGFKITNTYVPPTTEEETTVPDTTPPTGDSSSILMFAAVFATAAVAVVLLGKAKKQEQD